MTSLRRKEVVLLILIVLTLSVIWGNSMLPASLSAALSGSLRDFLNTLLGITGGGGLEGDGWLRKAAHITEFAVLGIELAVLFAGHRSQDTMRTDDGAEELHRKLPFTAIIARKALLFGCGFTVAVIDETIQLFSDGRAGMVQDVWIDFIGFLAGTVIVWLVSRVRVSRRSRKAES